LKVDDKIEGSGSITQRHGSADPDPHQNVMDPQRWSKSCKDRLRGSNRSYEVDLDLDLARF
jgi:hypothetical protein